MGMWRAVTFKCVVFKISLKNIIKCSGGSSSCMFIFTEYFAVVLPHCAIGQVGPSHFCVYVLTPESNECAFLNFFISGIKVC